MSNLYWLNEDQMVRLRPRFPKSRGRPRDDDPLPPLAHVNMRCRAMDRGYDADWYREALIAPGIEPCIPRRKSRKTTVKYDKRRYRRRNRIEIMLRRLKD